MHQKVGYCLVVAVLVKCITARECFFPYTICRLRLSNKSRFVFLNRESPRIVEWRWKAESMTPSVMMSSYLCRGLELLFYIACCVLFTKAFKNATSWSRFERGVGQPACPVSSEVMSSDKNDPRDASLETEFTTPKTWFRDTSGASYHNTLLSIHFWTYLPCFYGVLDGLGSSGMFLSGLIMVTKNRYVCPLTIFFFFYQYRNLEECWHS